MSLRTRVLLLAGIFLTALLGIGWVWHSTMQQLYQQADELSQRSARCELLGTPLDDEQRDMAKMARASGEALLWLVEDVLDFSKIEANEIVRHDEVFSLASLTDEIALILGPIAYANLTLSAGLTP